MFLSDLVASYLFKKVKANFHPTTYHGIYIDDGLVVFTGKSNAKEVKNWLKRFSKHLTRQRETNTYNLPRKYG